MFHLSKSMMKKFVQTPMKFPQQQQYQMPPSQSQGPGPGPGPGRDMRGPGIDLTSLGGGFDISTLLGVMNQGERPREQQEEELSDIISIGSEVKDLEVSSTGEPRRRKRTKKKELVL